MKYEQIEITVPCQQTGPAKLTAFLLDNISVAEERRRPAVILCPGGGYRICSDREGEPVAMQFLAQGCHGFVLDYSVAPNRYPTALLELAKTVALIRKYADTWHVDPERIYVCGFSAGGHLACSLGVYWNQKFVYEPLGVTAEDIKPNGMILCYSVITSGEYGHEGSFKNLLGEEASLQKLEAVSLERQVSENTPQAFIWHTWQDALVPVENSLMLASAMRKHGVNFELHIYPKGGHAAALANKETSGARIDPDIVACQSWIHLAQTWLENIKK